MSNRKPVVRYFGYKKRGNNNSWKHKIEKLPQRLCGACIKEYGKVPCEEVTRCIRR